MIRKRENTKKDARLFNLPIYQFTNWPIKTQYGRKIQDKRIVIADSYSVGNNCE